MSFSTLSSDFTQWKATNNKGGFNTMAFAAFWAKRVDNENRVTDLLGRIKSIHIKLSLASYTMIYLLKLTGHFYEIMPNHEFFYNIYHKLCQKFLENGVAVLTERYKIQYEIDIHKTPIPKQSFFQIGRACELSMLNNEQDSMNDDDSNLHPDELARRKANALPNLRRILGMNGPSSSTTTSSSSTTSSSFDPHFIALTDISINDPALSDEEKVQLAELYEFKLQMLESRYEKLLVDIKDFHQTFASNPTILRLIQDANPQIFEDESIIRQISWFGKEKFARLIRKTPEEMIEDVDYTFDNITMFWNVMTLYDDVEYHKKCEELQQTEQTLPRDQVEQHRPTFWYNLNNCILLSTLLINIRDDDIEEFFRTLKDVYIMFLDGKLVDFTDFYTRVITNARRIFPEQLNGKGIGLPSEQVLHFLFQAATSNVGYFTTLVKEVKYAIPDGFKDFIKTNWGYDIDAFNLSKIMREHCLELLTLKKENLTFLEILERKHQEAIKNQQNNQQHKNTGVHKWASYLATSKQQ